MLNRRHHILSAFAVLLLPCAALSQRASLPLGWPAMPEAKAAPADSQYISTWGETPEKVYRRVYFVVAKPTANGDSLKALFTRLKAMPVGGHPEALAYYLRVPDPGPSAANIDKVVGEFRKSSAVKSVVPLAVAGLIRESRP